MNKMETDDDIQYIYDRSMHYISDIEKQEFDFCMDQLKSIDILLQCKIPYGFTQTDWNKLQDRHKIAKNMTHSYQLNHPNLITYSKKSKEESSKKKRGSPKSNSVSKQTISYKEAKEKMAEFTKIKDLDALKIQLYMYETEAKKIINEYHRIIENPIHTDFMTIKRSELTKETSQLKIQLISLIMGSLGEEACEKIINRKYQKSINHDSDDYSSDDQMNEDVDEDWSGMVFNDLNRISFNQKYKYDKKQHFRDTINQYQGLQHKNIPQTILDDVIDMAKKHGLIDYTKETTREQFSKLSKEHVRMFLEETGHSKSYEDLQLIYHKITTNPCPNIQKYEQSLYDDFDQLVEAYLNLPSSTTGDRKNFLNNHYILRQLLKRRGMIVPENDLNVLKTPSRLRKHDDIYQQCCNALGWNFTPLS